MQSYVTVYSIDGFSEFGKNRAQQTTVLEAMVDECTTVVRLVSEMCSIYTDARHIERNKIRLQATI